MSPERHGPWHLVEWTQGVGKGLPITTLNGDRFVVAWGVILTLASTAGRFWSQFRPFWEFANENQLIFENSDQTRIMVKSVCQTWNGKSLGTRVSCFACSLPQWVRAHVRHCDNISFGVLLSFRIQNLDDSCVITPLCPTCKTQWEWQTKKGRNTIGRQMRPWSSLKTPSGSGVALWEIHSTLSASFACAWRTSKSTVWGTKLKENIGTFEACDCETGEVCVWLEKRGLWVGEEWTSERLL